jgi:hypothetical protein
MFAMSANLLDVILGFGETEVVIYGTKSATEWFSLFQANWFKGLYTLGILNIVYMSCMIPVYFAVLAAHHHKHFNVSAMAMVVFLLALAIYVSNNAAIPMFVLSVKYASAGGDAQRALFAAAGQAILARGEDFTPGSFIGLILSGIAAITISIVMLRGGIFGKANGWIGIIGFTFLSVFTILSTFIPSLYLVAFYVFGMIGGLFALTWFVLVARTFFRLGRASISS